MSRLKHLGIKSSVGRTLSNYFAATIAPEVYKLYSVEGKARDGKAKRKFNETKLFEAMKG